MAAIPISQSTQKALNRFVEILSSSLLTSILEDRESGDYPLPPPDTWIQGRTNLSSHWRNLNVEAGLGIVVPAGQSEVIQDYTGDGEKYSRTQRTPYDVGIIIQSPAAYPTVTTQGREMLDDEWLLRRVELYRGALLDVCTQHIPEKDSIHEIFISAHEADLFEMKDSKKYAHATVTFEALQDVLINTW